MTVELVRSAPPGARSSHQEAISRALLQLALPPPPGARRRWRQVKHFERNALRELERLNAPDHVIAAALELIAGWRAAL